MKRVFIILCTVIVIGCSDSKSATKALEDAGYTEVHITGYRWTGCSEDDAYHTGFTAKGPTGRPVSGVVCEGIGWGKGKTIRLD